ncbi:MAG: hypothetical protein ACREAC_09075, partial [Blastocatellia bacterium]
FVVAVAEYYGLGIEELGILAEPAEETRRAIELIRFGYGVGQEAKPAGVETLLYQVGFHSASFVLAREEFCLLDAVLTARVPDLVAYVESEEIGNAWRYVSRFRAVEEIEVWRTLQSIDLGLEFSADEERVQLLKTTRLGAEAAAMARFAFLKSLISSESPREALSRPSAVSLDLPNVREAVQCSLCSGLKERGQLACSKCYYSHGLRFGSPVIERRLANVEVGLVRSARSGY